MVEDHGDHCRDQRQDALDAHDRSGSRPGAGADRGAPVSSPPTAGLSLPGSTGITTGTGTYMTRSSTSACQGLVQATPAASITNTTTTAAVMAARDVRNHQAVPQPVRDNCRPRRRPFTPGASFRCCRMGAAAG